MASYNAEYPSGITVRPEVAAFFKEFYRVSDTPGLHDEYINQFTEDATFILASKVSKGSEEILRTRKAMWDSVVSRKHTVPKVFPFGNDASEVMLYGKVELGLRSGESKSIDWAARAQLVESEVDGKLRMSFYQVYLDTGATTAYKK